MTSAKDFFKRLFSFEGRSSQRDYFVAQICQTFLFIPFFLSDLANDPYRKILLGVVLIFIIFGQLTVTVRRFHDTGKSAWYVPLMFIPPISLFCLYYLWILPGDAEANKYGAPA